MMEMDIDTILTVPSQYFEDPSHYNVPLHAIRRSAIKELAGYLDEEKQLHNGFIPDFGGVAEKAGFNSREIKSFERSNSPTMALLNEWMDRQDLNPTVGHLVKILAELEREDILTDCRETILREVKDFVTHEERFMQGPVQDATVSSGPGEDTVPKLCTRLDVTTGKEIIYDAFVCYNPLNEATKDLEFVRELIHRLESKPYNLKLFVPWRDDLAGFNTHTINAKIISERCRHMIVVLSPNFLQSDACEFQSTFAHSLSPSARNKRVVPIKIEECEVPNIMRIMACCDFTKRELWDWSWDRLARSIQLMPSPKDFVLESNPNSEFEISLNSLVTKTAFDLSTSMLPRATLVSSEIPPLPVTGKSGSDLESGFESMGEPSKSGSSPVPVRNRTAPVALSVPRTQEKSEKNHSHQRYTAPVKSSILKSLKTTWKKKKEKKEAVAMETTEC